MKLFNKSCKEVFSDVSSVQDVKNGPEHSGLWNSRFHEKVIGIVCSFSGLEKEAIGMVESEDQAVDLFKDFLDNIYTHTNIYIINIRIIDMKPLLICTAITSAD